MLKFLISALSVIALSFLIITLVKKTPEKSVFTMPLRVGNSTFQVELADEPKEYVQGLSDRSSIPSNAGMLFVLPGETRPIFWMKAMHFPLDIIWIRDKRVIDINENLPVPTGNLLPTYSPKDNADMVLEVPAGSVARKRLAVGDVVVVDDAAITKQAQERDQP